MSDNDGFRPDWANKDFYAELGVAKDADAAAIKKAYRKLARANHPDSNPGDTAKHEKFKAVAEAYDVVGDPEKRKKYDEMRALGMGFGSGAGGGFGGGFGGSRGGGFDPSDLFNQYGGQRGGGSGGFGDMFGDLFGGANRRQARPVKGADVEATTTIGFTEALDGTTISIRLSSDGACPVCHGTGGKPGTKPHVCPTCEGAGYVVESMGGAFSINETCPACGGRQLVYDEPCPACGGSGRGTSTRTVQARIPAGVKDGQKIRLRGKGGPGENGGPAGDLFIRVTVTPHRIFGRKDANLTVHVPITVDEAVLGAEIKVPTLGGAPVRLKVPAGTPSGRTFRVRGKGVHKSDGSTGDLLVTVEVQVPNALNDTAKEALASFAAAMGDDADPRASLYGG